MAEVKKQYTDEDLETQRMRQILAQGEFDDLGVGDGTIKYIAPEDYLLLRNSRHVGVKRNAIYFIRESG